MEIRERKLSALGAELMDYMECVRQELEVKPFFNDYDAKYLAEKLLSSLEQAELDEMVEFQERNVSCGANN